MKTVVNKDSRARHGFSTLAKSCQKMGIVGMSESLGKKNSEISKSILYLACYAGTKSDTLYSATESSHGARNVREKLRSDPMAMLILTNIYAKSSPSKMDTLASLLFNVLLIHYFIPPA